MAASAYRTDRRHHPRRRGNPGRGAPPRLCRRAARRPTARAATTSSRARSRMRCSPRSSPSRSPRRSSACRPWPSAPAATSASTQHWTDGRRRRRHRLRRPPAAQPVRLEGRAPALPRPRRAAWRSAVPAIPQVGLVSAGLFLFAAVAIPIFTLVVYPQQARYILDLGTLDPHLRDARLGPQHRRRPRRPARSRLRRLLRGRRLFLRAARRAFRLVVLDLPAARRHPRRLLGHHPRLPGAAAARRLSRHRDPGLRRDHPPRPDQLVRLHPRPRRHQPHPAAELLRPRVHPRRRAASPPSSASTTRPTTASSSSTT